MSKPSTVSIPVRLHVKQYLLQEFGIPGLDYIQIHQNTFMGKALLLGLEKSPYRQLKPKEPAPHKEDLQIMLPTALKHFSLSRETRKQLGELLDKFFQQQLYLFIKGQLAITGNELHAINTFIRLYNIDPDSYDVETARKSWRDYKDNVLKANKRAMKLQLEAA